MYKILAILATVASIIAGVFGFIKIGKTTERKRQLAENAEAHTDVAEARADTYQKTEDETRKTINTHFTRDTDTD